MAFDYIFASGGVHPQSLVRGRGVVNAAFEMNEWMKKKKHHITH